MTTTIRPPVPADEARWRELFRAYGLFYETEFADDVLERVWSLVTTEGSGIDALLAERDGEVVGIAHFRSFPDTFTGGRDWYLDDLFVDPAARGTGAGRALIEAIAERARTSGPAGTLRWITAESNTTAQALYERIATRTSWVTYEMRF
jgi:GNAT superfamily N-acetyltransferase